MGGEATVPSMHPYILLAISIAAEVSRPRPSNPPSKITWPAQCVLAVLGYCAAFYLVSKVMNHMATGVVYAIWSGLGIVLISLVGWWLYGQRLTWPAVVGMLMIVGGVVVIQVLSKTAGN